MKTVAAECGGAGVTAVQALGGGEALGGGG